MPKNQSESTDDKKVQAATNASETATASQETANAATTSESKDAATAAANDGGRAAAAASPQAATAPINTVAPTTPATGANEEVNLADHPVEKAKEALRAGAREHLSAVAGDKSNLTATQIRAMQDQELEMQREESAAPEPARGPEQSVGSERKAGLRTAMPESERNAA